MRLFFHNPSKKRYNCIIERRVAICNFAWYNHLGKLFPKLTSNRKGGTLIVILISSNFFPSQWPFPFWSIPIPNSKYSQRNNLILFSDLTRTVARWFTICMWRVAVSISCFVSQEFAWLSSDAPSNRPVTRILCGGVLTRPKWTKLPKCIFYFLIRLFRKVAIHEKL